MAGITGSFRATGFVLICSGLAEFALLAAHPESTAHDFAGLLRDQAAGQLSDAIVHGGFIVLLGIQLGCYAMFARALDSSHPLSVFGLVFMAFGAAFLSASVMTDGLILPSLASHYASLGPDRQNTIRGVFAFAGTAIGWLMPFGLGFQGAAIAVWSFRLFVGSKLAGAAGLSLAIAIAAALASATILRSFSPIMAALAVTVLWALLSGALLVGGIVGKQGGPAAM
jgi:hypothetical protein